MCASLSYAFCGYRSPSLQGRQCKVPCLACRKVRGASCAPSAHTAPADPSSTSQGGRRGRGGRTSECAAVCTNKLPLALTGFSSLPDERRPQACADAMAAVQYLFKYLLKNNFSLYLCAFCISTPIYAFKRRILKEHIGLKK